MELITFMSLKMQTISYEWYIDIYPMPSVFHFPRNADTPLRETYDGVPNGRRTNKRKTERNRSVRWRAHHRVRSPYIDQRASDLIATFCVICAVTQTSELANRECRLTAR